MSLGRMFLGFTTEEKSTLPALKEHLHPLLVSAACLPEPAWWWRAAAWGRGGCPVRPWEQLGKGGAV